MKRSGRPKVRRATPRRVSVDRDPEYLAWLRERPCCIAQASKQVTRTEAAHTANNGMRSKGPDSSCVPLCWEHHREQHRIGVKDFEAKYGIDLANEAAAHHAAYLIWKEHAS